MTYRIGYACKWLNPDRTLPSSVIKESEKLHNFSSTTNKWLSSKSRDVAYQRLSDIIEHNISSVKRQISWIESLKDENSKMLRIGSDLLPFYTHKNWETYYSDHTVRTYIEKSLMEIGTLLRSLDIKVSFHPGQFVVLASDRDCVVENSIKEFEYHVDILKMMGYCRSRLDAKCNVHVSGRRGISGFMETLNRLSPEARMVMTVENDEITCGLDSILELRKDCGIVLDLHHHFVNCGEYIDPNDDRVKKVIDSWHGQRPTLHYSLSACLEETHCENSMPKYEDILVEHKKQKIRAHSKMMWNKKCNEWALSFLENFDIMVEAKSKNLASRNLLEQARLC